MLIIYDQEGKVICTMSDNAIKPVGVPYITTDIPLGKYIKSIDVSGAEHIPVFSDLPKSEIQVLQEQINELIITLGDALLNGGI
jgi:hypothetical protein